MHDRVEQRLHAFVLKSGAAKQRHDLVRQHALSQAAANLVLGQRAALDVFFHQRLVRFGRGFDQMLPPFFDLGRKLGGDGVDYFVARALRVVALFPDDGALREQIDNAGEAVFGADRQLHRNDPCAQPLGDLPPHTMKIGADAIHFVHKSEARHAIFRRLPPDRFGLRLHAADRAKNADRAVQNPQRALDLDREVDMPRRVDNVDAVLRHGIAHAFPKASRRG